MPTLQEIKKSKGLTNVAVGRVLGISPSKAGAILQGRHLSVYSDEEIEQLAHVLGITFERCWSAMCESYDQLMGSNPSRQYKRASEYMADAQASLGLPIEEPRPIGMIEGSLALPEDRRICGR